jgi:AdoMet-dependent heme synthase
VTRRQLPHDWSLGSLRRTPHLPVWLPEMAMPRFPGRLPARMRARTPGLVQLRMPEARFRFLDTLWIQLTGTRCNIACRHCFSSCGPKADQIPMMSTAQVEEALEDGRSLGMRQVYFTGGEPFLHPQLPGLVRAALRLAPLTLVTNGLLIDDAAVGVILEESQRSRYSLDLRVSLDGTTAEENDRMRGRGTFDRVLATLQRLGRAGLSPLVAVVEHEGIRRADAREPFLQLLRDLGISRPRVQFQPLLRIGREMRRTHGYSGLGILASAPLLSEVESKLLCATARAVTSQGVYTCPMLVEHQSARLGDRLAGSLRPIRLNWDTCQTCMLDGMHGSN